MTRVLVLPGSTEIGLEIHRSLAPLRDVALVGGGAEPAGHGPFIFATWERLPSVFEEGWVEALNRVVGEHAIDVVFPAHDDVVYECAVRRREMTVPLVAPSTETCEITRYKSRTYSRLDRTVPTPRRFVERPRPDDFPVFVRPDRGQGSSGAELLPDERSLSCWADRVGASWLDGLNGWVCTSVLPGREYTVDCFSDRDDGLLFVGARERLRVRNGISVATRRVVDERLTEMAHAIANALPMQGAWFFQAKLDEAGSPTLLEVAPRIAGMMGFQRARGVNLAALALFEALRIPVRILENPIEVVSDRALIARYEHDFEYRRAYIDLDDTLVRNGQVDVNVMRFVFQCINRGVEVVLLTRHSGDLPRTLASHRLTGIFDRVVHVPTDRRKDEYIDGEGAVFVDDSFSERATAADRTGVVTFDCPMLEVLLDDRA